MLQKDTFFSIKEALFRFSMYTLERKNYVNHFSHNFLYLLKLKWKIYISNNYDIHFITIHYIIYL